MNEAIIFPRIDLVRPKAALAGGEVELEGEFLGPVDSAKPTVHCDGDRADLLMCRPTRLRFRLPEGAITGAVEVRRPGGGGTAIGLRVGRELSDGLHMVTNPVLSPSGMIFATISGPRGKAMPVSVVRVSQTGQGTPFVSGILNATGLAMNPEGELFVSSRAEGNVYKVDAGGEFSLYAGGMGTATGMAFDRHGNLYVGDRSGTIFKIDPDRRIFVFATLEPSVSAYHLAFSPDGALFVTGPTLSPNEAIWAIDLQGQAHLWYRGLGRAQGLAFDPEGRLCVAACLHGERGLIRFEMADRPELAVAAPNLVGVAFSPQGRTVLATQDRVYDFEEQESAAVE